MTFDEWYGELRRIAKTKKLCWLLSRNREAHRDAYNDGLTPRDELLEQVGAVEKDI